MTDTPESPESTEPHDRPEAEDTHASQDAQAEPTPSESADIGPPLATLIAAIRAAVARSATAEARAAGATACRSILTVLDAQPGQPLAVAPQPVAPPASPASPASPLAGLFSQPGFLSKLAAMSREQLLDLAKQLTGSMPAQTPTPTSAGPRFHLIQIPQVRPPRGT